MSDIYDQHKAAFSNVSAYIIARDGERVATIAFKYPRDGAGRLYAYVHWLGSEMVRGYASGGGYDKHSAACSSAAHKLEKVFADFGEGSPRQLFRLALLRDGGEYWHTMLRNADFEVWQAV